VHRRGGVPEDWPDRPEWAPVIKAMCPLQSPEMSNPYSIGQHAAIAALDRISYRTMSPVITVAAI
jgi:hypothetical protein